MLRNTCLIKIGDSIEYRYANTIEVEEGWEGLTDTARIVFPRKTSMKGSRTVVGGLTPLFKRGDPVEIYLGYYPNQELLYQGFVSEINVKIPLEVRCEDEMWNLKQTQARKVPRTGVTGKGLTLKQLLTAILPDGYSFDAIDTNVGDWRISGNANVSNVLEELRSKHKIFSRIVNGKLYSGLAFIPELQKTRKFYFERNIIDWSDLRYQLAEDVRVKVKVNAFYPDNKKVEPYEFGDLDGDLRTINLYNVPAADIQTAANRELERLKYTGYRGSFVTFGEPTVNSGDVVSLFSTELPERNGKYLVKKVVRSFSESGYRQKIEIEAKV
jgi:hypothetical protein